MNKTDNPLFAIAKEKWNNDLYSFDYSFMQKTDVSQDTYTLGFCRGVSHATDIFQKQIADLQSKLAAMESK